MWLAKIYVTLKPVVNDPQGLAIRGGLHMLGFDSVESVRVGKYIEIRVTEADPGVAENSVRQMCAKLLANPVIEDFRFELEAIPQSDTELFQSN
jgi:phosphoribosylformylglycinamidine synthase